MSDTTAAVVDSYKHGSAIVGNPSDPALLVQGHLVDAEVLVLPSSDMVLNKTVFAAARELKHDCRIIVRVANPENLRAVPSDEHTRILNDTQIASESLGEAVADVFGIGAQVRHEKAVARGEATNDVDEDEGAAIIAQARAEAAASAARHAARNTLPPFDLRRHQGEDGEAPRGKGEGEGRRQGRPGHSGCRGW